MQLHAVTKSAGTKSANVGRGGTEARGAGVGAVGGDAGAGAAGGDADAGVVTSLESFQEAVVMPAASALTMERERRWEWWLTYERGRREV